MTLAPRDYITERRREIHQRIEGLNAELAVLDRMESALGDGPLLSPTLGLRVGPPTAAVASAPKRRQRVEGGIKSMVLFVLAHIGPRTANQILSEIKHTYDIDLPRTTLSPQLSRLKKDGFVRVDDAVWAVTDKGREHFMLS